jgi:hypothetical protein
MARDGERADYFGVSALVVAVLLGFGGFGVAVYLGFTEPQWCNVGFAGCLGTMFWFALGGSVAGLIASCFSLKTTGLWRLASLLVLVCNATGMLLSIGVVLWFFLR